MDVRGGFLHPLIYCADIAPTFLEMEGISHPAPTYWGRQVEGMRGKSMVPWLNGRSNTIYEKSFTQGWEMSGLAAIRKDAWKAVYFPSRRAGPSPAVRDRWELFDLSKDRGETNDSPEQHPSILKQLFTLWDQYVIETGVVPLNSALGEYIEATEVQMPNDGWMEYDGAKQNPEKPFVTPKRFNCQGTRIAQGRVYE